VNFKSTKSWSLGL